MSSEKQIPKWNELNDTQKLMVMDTASFLEIFGFENRTLDELVEAHVQALLHDEDETKCLLEVYHGRKYE